MDTILESMADEDAVGIPIGIGQPRMEGPQGALNGKPHAHKTDGHDQRHPVFPGLPQQQDALLNVCSGAGARSYRRRS